MAAQILKIAAERMKDEKDRVEDRRNFIYLFLAKMFKNIKMEHYAYYLTEKKGRMDLSTWKYTFGTWKGRGNGGTLVLLNPT